MTRQEQIKEMIDDLNDFCIRSDSDRDIERILPVVYWLEAKLEEENK